MGTKILELAKSYATQNRDLWFTTARRPIDAVRLVMISTPINSIFQVPRQVHPHVTIPSTSVCIALLHNAWCNMTWNQRLRSVGNSVV
jgi:hypothetical protein